MFTATELTDEEQAINDAIDAHQEAMKDDFHAFTLAVVLYLAGLFLSAIGEDGSRLDNIGNALLGCAVLTFLVHLWLNHRSRKYKRAVRELMQPYMRRKALPFYQELVEMFADKPGVHLHLEEDGKIVVTDKRKTPIQGEGELHG